MTNPHNPMIDTNDPRLTAYVLGELAPAEVAQIEAAQKSSSELRAAIADIRRATESLTNVFLTEPSLQLTSEQKTELLAEAESAANSDVHSAVGSARHSSAANVTPVVTGEHYRPTSASTARWLKIAIVASLASLLIGGAFYFSGTDRDPIAAVDKAAMEENPSNLNSSADKDEESSEILELAQRERSEAGDGVELNDTQSLPQVPAVQGLRTSQQRSFNPKKNSDQSGAGFELAAKRFSKAPSAEAAAQPAVEMLAESDAAIESALPFDGMLKSKSAKGEGTPRGIPPSAAAPSSAVQNFHSEMKDHSKQTRPFKAQHSALKATSPTLDVTMRSKSTLALAQESLDQSSLRSVNLKVVAQAHRQAFGSGGGTGHSQPKPAVKKLAADSFAAGGDDELTGPTIFELKISDQDAKRTVQLLATYADPQQKRKLTFDDLIAFQSLPLVAKGMALNDLRPDAIDSKPASDDRDLIAGSDYKADRETNETNMAFLAPSPAAPQHVTAAMLATELREFVGQRLAYRSSNHPSESPDVASYGDKASELNTFRSPADNDAAVDDMAMDDATTNDRNFVQPLRAAAGQRGRDQQLPADFDFDYSQVVQQLKLQLEIRNQSLDR